MSEPMLSPDDEPSKAGKNALKRRVDELERRVATLEAELEHPRFDWQAARQNLKPRVLVVATTLLALIPPLLVVRDRWLASPFLPSRLDRWWQGLGLQRYLSLPSYFLLILPCFLGLLILIWYNKKSPLIVFSNLSFDTLNLADAKVSLAQSHASRLVWMGSALGFVLSIARALILHRMPGWDLALALLAYLGGWVLREIPVERVINACRQNQDLLLSLLLAHLALITFLASVFSTGKPMWIFTLLLALATLNLLRHYRKVSPIFWVISLALVLYTLGINSWRFSVVGDEYSFFHFAREIAERKTLSFIGSNLFNGSGVYGTHPYLSSYIQALFMKLLGSQNFGWRFSNIYLSAMAIGFFFMFFETFMPRRIALLASLFLACSQYLMAFGKIGYNNLQALFAMSLVLWATAWALRTRRPLAFVVLGLALGLCFYVYPAALYVVPLPVLLLLLYDPPRSRPAYYRWAILALSLFLFIFPLLFQPAYWETKRAGTFFNDPQIMQSLASVFRHLTSNLLYAFVSFVYVMEESHFVAASYMDPLSGALVVIGLACLLKEVRRTRFALFLVLGFALLLFLVGASHDTRYTRTTRMFLLLPWFALFAAMGLTWILQQIRLLRAMNRAIVAAFTCLFVIVVIGVNLYQAYVLPMQRLDRYQSLESLFLRTAMRAQRLEGESRLTFVFITDPEWGIDGIRANLQPVYAVPASPTQLVQVTVTDIYLPESAYAVLSDPWSLVIIKPWLDPEWKSALETSLRQLGKVSCDVKTAKGTVRFQLWHSGVMDKLCQ